MGYLNSGIMRLLLESALYFASLTNSSLVGEIIQGEPKIDTKNISTYFYDKIVITIDSLASYLQKSPDESLLFVHFVLREAYESNRSRKTLTNNYTQMNFKEERERFEKEFCSFLDKIMKQQNKTVQGLIEHFTNLLVIKDLQNSDYVFKVSHDLVPVSKINKDTLDFLNCSSHWTFRRQLTIKSFTNDFNSFKQQQQETNFKLLDEFLRQLGYLELVQYLPRIINMVKLLHGVSNRQLDKHTATKLSLAEFIEANKELNENAGIVCMGAKYFLDLWNRLSQSISLKLNSRIVSRFNKSRNLLENVITKEDCSSSFKYLPMSYLLPTNHGDGIYIYALIFFLMNLQNEFILFYRNCTYNNTLISDQIDFDAITDNDCLSISSQNDFLSIVFLNSNYSLERANELNFDFNYFKIQESVVRKFLVDKQLLDFSVSLFF